MADEVNFTTAEELVPFIEEFLRESLSMMDRIQVSTYQDDNSVKTFHVQGCNGHDGQRPSPPIEVILDLQLQTAQISIGEGVQIIIDLHALVHLSEAIFAVFGMIGSLEHEAILSKIQQGGFMLEVEGRA